MNTRRNKVVVTLCAVLALAFNGCSEKEVEELKTGVTPSDIQIQSVSYSTDNGTLDNKSTVTFSINVKNEGGLDLAGATVQAYVNNSPAGFAKTGELGSVLDVNSEKTVTIDWDAVAGQHSAVFYIVSDTTAFTDAGNKRLDLVVATAKIEVEDFGVVEAEVGEAEVKSLVTGDQTVSEIVENIDELVVASTDKSENEVAVLKTIKAISDENLTIAEGNAPTEVTFEDNSVSALLLPLASKENPTVAEEGSYLVSISTEVEEVIASEVTESGDVVKTKAKKKVAVPVAVKRDEAAGTTAFKNSLGGFTVAKDGTISVNAATRAGALDFWDILASQLAQPANLLSNVLNSTVFGPAEKLSAMVNFIGEMTSVIAAYELQTQLTNEKPEIEITAGTKTYSVKDGNDRLDITYDVFTATVSDDKEGASFENGAETQVFNPGKSATLADVSFLFVATDSEGESATVTVTSSYTSQRIVDYYAHDQGGNVQQ